MSSIVRKLAFFGRLEFFLFLAAASLVLQLVPAWGILVWNALTWVLDIRNWSRSAWLGINVSVVLLLVGIRMAPEFVGRERVARLPEDKEAERIKNVRERREAIDRAKQARKRRLY
jgi:hypothetical protein